MKMKNIEVINTLQTLAALAEKRLPVKVSYAVARNISELQKISADIEKERQKLIQEYAVLGDDGKPRTKKNEDGQDAYELRDEAAYKEEYVQLLEAENDFEPHYISEAELESQSDRYDVLTVAEMMSLAFMIQ
ncbi:hypothetical protein [Cuneatibacter caecimuris]|uniref:Uncharacterized protein n=1 Tax=Cuneatibacter caecimuris TaxID=1796618 RepID=A0A4Q7PS09_9FIRM|nr:hypothetical protein [Cuneatibacter caecimuris]RZT02898.1 hypothetical protein EV209_1028 [Cuneatibacter caecimuris]